MVVERRKNSKLEDMQEVYIMAEFKIPYAVSWFSLTQQSCVYWINELANIDILLFSFYFRAVAFLHVASKIAKNSTGNEFIGIIETLLRQSILVGKRRCCNQIRSLCSLTEATKLMKVVANNSCSTVQLVEIELSKAYLYRALRCKDSDSVSIYCLANVYLAVLYYTTGQYQKAIDHCTVVTRSHNHSQCRSHVVQGKLIPKIDNDIDSVLGLAVFYQYVQTAALNQQQQTQHVSVFSTELFAHYLHIRCHSVVKCRQLTQMSSADEVQRYIKYVLDSKQPITTDVLLLKSMRLSWERICHSRRQTEQLQKITTNGAELDTSKLVELLQQSAVEHLGKFRLLQVGYFHSLHSPIIVPTDFEALYAYKRGHYERCLRLTMQNVDLLHRWHFCSVDAIGLFMLPEFIQLLDDDIVSLVALTLAVDPDYRKFITPKSVRLNTITQLTLSLYLMTQCQLKLHHSLTQTLHYIEKIQRKYPVDWTLDHLILKLAKRKIHLMSTK